MQNALRPLTLLFLFLTQLAVAGELTITGSVFSYNSQKMLLLKKAQKHVSFEGPLSAVSVILEGQDYKTTYTTGGNGFFLLRVPQPGKYHITVARDGYSTLQVDFIFDAEGNKSRIESLMFILKSDDKSSIRLGELNFDGNKLVYTSGSGDDDVFHSNANLLEKATGINNQGSSGYAQTDKTQNRTDNKAKDKDNKPADTVKIRVTDGKSIPTDLFSKFTSNNPDSLAMHLEEARARLKSLPKDSEEYRWLKSQIELAEQKIRDKEKIIDLQNSEIAYSRKIIIYLVLVLVLAVAAAGLLFWFFRQKKLHAIALRRKNIEITRINNRLLSSIRYASIIQKNYLPAREELQKLYSDSFVFMRPRDILSGDFFWVKEKNDHRIIVVADCTGHGVPGAMLTVLGNRILEEVVTADGEVSPAGILWKLNCAIQETFSRIEDYMEYGMDISVVSIDKKTGDMRFSGIGNNLYQYSGNELKITEAIVDSIGPDLRREDLREEKITYRKGDTFFIFSDGYADQFGGGENSRKKFNLPRFKALLQEVSTQETLGKGDVLLEKTLENWMGAHHAQVDDICVLGFRV